MHAANARGFEQYHATLYSHSQKWRDFEATSAGFGEWYHDCLPRDRSARVLDIGCGDGKFLHFLQKAGYTAIEGVELSDGQAQEARKHVSCPVHSTNDTLSFLRDRTSSYQLITLNDVLEHVSKDGTVGMLEAIREALVAGGHIIVNVPQMSGLTSTFCRYDDFTHTTLFTEMSLRQVLSHAGFGHVRFVRHTIAFKFTPRHMAYRLARFVWHCILRMIYTVERPGERCPRSFDSRLVACAQRNPSA